MILRFTLLGMMLAVTLIRVVAQDGDPTTGYADQTGPEKLILLGAAAAPAADPAPVPYAGEADLCLITRCIPEAENPDKCLSQPCMPGDEPPRSSLTCQVSGGWCQALAAIANAQKGDISYPACVT